MNIKNQQRSSDLSFVDEKIRLSKGSSANNLRHAYIMGYPTKQKLKNYEFQSRDSHSNLLFKSETCINQP